MVGAGTSSWAVHEGPRRSQGQREPVLAGFMVCTDVDSGLGGVEESRHGEDD